MLTPPQIIHAVHGSPQLDTCGEGDGRCYVCGGTVVRGVPVGSWMSSNYTDQTRVRAPEASHTCEACVFLSSRTSPVLGRPAGACKVCEGTGCVVKLPPKGKGSKATVGDPCPKCGGEGQASAGGNFRNYSHLWESDWKAPKFGVSGESVADYANASKGQKPIVREFLERHHTGPWFAAIADSGQKHVALYAPLNGRGRAGRVLFDEQLVRIPSDTRLIGDMVSALTAGLTKDELERGEYRQLSWQETPEAIEEFESAHSSERGCSWFKLALWVAQRDEEDHAKRAEKRTTKRAEDKAKRPARKPPSRSDSGDAGRVRQRAGRAPSDGLLGPDRAASAPLSSERGGRGRVGEQPAARVADPRTGQLGLF